MAFSASAPTSRYSSAPLEQQYTRAEVAELLGVGESTVRKWINEGQLRAYRYGARLVRVDAADVRRFRTQLNTPTYARAHRGGGAA